MMPQATHALAVNGGLPTIPGSGGGLLALKPDAGRAGPRPSSSRHPRSV